MTSLLWPEGSYSPLHWNGRDRYSTSAPLRSDFETKCLSCGRGEFLSLTEADVRARRPAQCGSCGGRMLLERADCGMRVSR